jgi:hypothetical protein
MASSHVSDLVLESDFNVQHPVFDLDYVPANQASTPAVSMGEADVVNVRKLIRSIAATAMAQGGTRF